MRTGISRVALSAFSAMANGGQTESFTRRGAGAEGERGERAEALDQDFPEMSDLHGSTSLNAAPGSRRTSSYIRRLFLGKRWACDTVVPTDCWQPERVLASRLRLSRSVTSASSQSLVLSPLYQSRKAFAGSCKNSTGTLRAHVERARTGMPNRHHESASISA